MDSTARESYQESVLQHANVGMALCDAKTFHFIYSNPTLRQWFKLDNEEKSFLDCLPKKEKKRFLKALEKNRVFRHKTTFKERSRELYIEFQSKTIELENGSPAIFIQGTINQSGKETQLLIKNHNTIIEKNNAQLIAEKIKVEAANNAKSNFLGAISHELSTPLNAIIGFSRILGKCLKKNNQVEHYRYIDKIINAATNLSIIVEDILQVAYIEKNTALSTEVSRASTITIIENITSYYARLKEKKEIVFSSKLEPDTPEYVLLDENKLKQAAYHLISNAHKFTEAGSIQLLLEPGIASNTLKITVHDTGIGIDEDFKEHMYSSFTQEDSSDSRTYGGTGLGLGICLKLIENMGGEIHCKSTKGVGTSMCIEVPFEEVNPSGM